MKQTADTAVTGSTVLTLGDSRINLLRRTSGQNFNETFDPDGASTDTRSGARQAEPVAAGPYLQPRRGQVLERRDPVYVDSSGNACDIVPGTPPTRRP